MPRYLVKAKWEGEASIEVEADDENHATDIARDTWVGFIVEGGHIPESTTPRR